MSKVDDSLYCNRKYMRNLEQTISFENLCAVKLSKCKMQNAVFHIYGYYANTYMCIQQIKIFSQSDFNAFDDCVRTTE